jgi:hypothetical protein
MEYACIICDPVTMKHLRELEMMQRRAARLVTGDYRTTRSVTQMQEESESHHALSHCKAILL